MDSVVATDSLEQVPEAARADIADSLLKPFEVHVQASSLDCFRPGLTAAEWASLQSHAEQGRERMRGRTFWNVNSTARGGGVAEMLPGLLAYARGAGVDTRWMVMRGTPGFFHITKRLHHALHGSRGDGSPLGPRERACYEDVLRDNAEELLVLIRPGDVVLLHDPQTAGLAPALAAMGAQVVWRCHIGCDVPNEEVERAWAFLAPGLAAARLAVFSRAAYVPPMLADRAVVIQPSIDIFAVKNQPLEPAVASAILGHVGLVGRSPDLPAPVFTRTDGVPARVARGADIVRLGVAPAPDVPLVVQVSRWDPLKDPVGVLRGFALLLKQSPCLRAELVLAGPSVTSVADDPEGAATFESVVAAWREQPRFLRQRVHLACLPMVDPEENAAIVNALQRHAGVVVQKSLKEGFGLTVTEAMWKSRPVVASAVGGIQDQVHHEVEGLLVRDPDSLPEFASAVRRLLEEPRLSARLGTQAHEQVRARFTAVRHLSDFASLLRRLDIRPEACGG
ncbi:glycosyltransferase [Corallococcus exiguus]|uniref:Glycosyltransferase n=1 Tax=Corallococcus exiguus TaxID=83462 RepID=A0A7X4Y994_9BACT|nr:glycosyltransferase [Corallococcus exiguus]NBC41228.1 glycosyltransferase [Corallococcus exiguus]TNV56031.1 glycosyltransferase [Corallococcus exiguus]